MALRAEQLKDELTEEVVRQVRGRLGRERAEAAERFVRQFYANVPPDDIVQAPADQLYGAAVAMWQWGQRRDFGRARVRVYNPRIEEHGWQSSRTVVEIVNDDMPFLVDSVTAELNRQGLTVHLVIHPVVKVRRDAEGRLLDLFEPDSPPDGALPESFMHVEVSRHTDPALLARVEEGLERILADVRAVVADWRPMRECVRDALGEAGNSRSALPPDEVAEADAFLRWLDDDHFTYLGYREYRFDAPENGGEPALTLVENSGLGILRDPAYTVFDGLRNFQSLPPDVRHFIATPRVLMISKANQRATVHRPVPMDAILVKRFNAQGRIVGERLIVGLFTSVAYNRSPRDIPFLRRKVAAVLELAGFDPKSHDGKALVNILETFPRDELFQIGADELYDMALGILHLQERQRLALFVRKDPFERFVSALVYVPRDRYDTALRLRMQAILEAAFNGACTAFYTQLAESVLARIHFMVKTEPGKVPPYAVAEIEARLVQATRSWADHLRDALVEAEGDERGAALFQRYRDAFLSGYREAFTAEAAVHDIARIEQALARGRLGLNLYRPLEAGADELSFKIYHAGRPVPLSDVLPMLEHMDLKVITEQPFAVQAAGHGAGVWIHDFTARLAAGGTVDLPAVKECFQDAFAAVWDGRMEDDGFNRLVLRAGLSARQVTILRAYAKYLKQARVAYAQDTLEATLAAHPDTAALIVRLFEARFDPARHDEHGPGDEPAILAGIDTALDAVSNLDEDRILRRFVNLVRSTLRTNAYQKGPDGQPKPYLSFKLDSAALDDLPQPRPWVEVFVYSPRMEGVHLRGGRVARGGIRWSDRREDFRTEILGLMKAQMVKNAVIVPVGSKGGFVVKRPPPASAGREAAMAEGIECYRTLMRGLLDVTDNLGPDGAVVPPPDVVRHDGDDPYLVVAADKGTATFSDIANGISLDYGFWLGDAFASGGSQGYDHKKMGITARGAWESVKRHFRELGRDIQSQDFTCVGVGDMSGDVFGNGMLLSRHTRLVGAFDHRHVFCDPDPDPETAWAERRRLFDLPRSSWADYDAARLSAGGRIYDRAAKAVELTPQIKARFGLAADHVTPADLIQAMLRADIDLLWLGGIGTYVKAAEESNAEVGDKANDALRIDAAQLRAKVVGEGANLGFTQRGRIEAARHGVRLNTDAIDNSAGVDTSDHEVNIKILLNGVVARGDMTMKQRDELLARMTDEVGALVLTDNYRQTEALTVAQARAAEMLEPQARFIRALERAGKLKRRLEFLPDEEELAERMAARQGLTRPELAVLLAYAKITLYDDLLASDLPDDPFMADDLTRYFPEPLRERFAEAIAGHRLRREIIATSVTNSLVNRVGPVFVKEMMEKTGMGPADVARAYAIVRDAFGLRALWAAIEDLDTRVPAAAQTAMLVETIALMERAVAWFLTTCPQPLDIAAETAAFRPGIETLAGDLDAILDAEEAARLAARALAYTAEGVPGDLARRVAALPVLASAPDLVRIAARTGRAVAAVAAVYFLLGRRFGLEWLRDKAGAVKADNHWQKQATAALVDELFAHQTQLTVRVLDGAGDPDAWITQRRPAVERVEQLLSELRTQPAVDLAMLAVANRQLRGLTAG